MTPRSVCGNTRRVSVSGPRVLHLITRLDTGGSSENVILSARYFSEKGQDTLVASGPSPDLTTEASHGELHRMLVPALVREIRPWKDIAAFFQIRKLLMTWRPDILHTHSSKAGILGRWAACFVGLPRMRVIHTPHGHVFYGYFGRVKSGLFVLLERITAWFTDVLVALSEGEKRESLELGIGASNQWVVIPSGVCFNDAPAPARFMARRDGAKENDFAPAEGGAILLRKEWNIPEKALVIGTVARLDAVKGVPVLVEAAARVLSLVPDETARFLIVGDGRQSRMLKARSKDLGIEDQIVFAGYQKFPGQFMGMMDIYVQPSLNEGMGKTLVMAQYWGLPIVASRVCGIPDVVLDRKSGLLVPAGDPEALAQALIELLRNPDLRLRLGREGKHWITETDETGFPRFSDQAMLRRLERLYQAETR